jgi:Uma2 family endonuclease
MPAAQKLALSPQEYLVRERAAEFKSEYIRGEVFAMSGASWEHTLVKDNLAHALRSRLQGGPCKVVTSDLRVKAARGAHYAYPDDVVVCEEPRFEDEVFDTLLNPTVIVEILSPSTERYDRSEKFRSYQTLASLQEYVLVSQSEALAERYVRRSNDSWLLTSFVGLDAELAFETLGVAAPLAEVYAGVTFPPPPENPYGPRE